MPNTNSSLQNLIESRQESYMSTSKRYLDNLINTIASYAPFIAFWTTWLYTIPEIEGYAIIARHPTTTTPPEPDQVEIIPLPLIPTRRSCHLRPAPFRASDINRLCNDDLSCIIL